MFHLYTNHKIKTGYVIKVRLQKKSKIEIKTEKIWLLISIQFNLESIYNKRKRDESPPDADQGIYMKISEARPI